MCSVETCERPVLATGLCRAHYNRLRKYGDVQAHLPVGRRARSVATLADRLARMTDENGPWSDLCGSRCYVVKRGRNRKGYGSISYEGKKVGAHRAAFFLHYGFWPTECRHRCDNPSCVRWEHLDDGSRHDNIMDSVERGRWTNQNTDKTVCNHGHSFTEENTGVDHRGHRFCRTCARLRARQRYRDHHPNVRVRV